MLRQYVPRCDYLNQLVAESWCSSLVQRLSQIEGITTSTAKVGHQALLIDAPVQFCACLVLISNKFHHLLVESRICLRTLVQLKLKDVHVDIGSDQIIMTLLYDLAF